MKQRIIIAGSRNFNNYPCLEYVVDRYFSKFVTDKQDVQIISGTAKGADSLGELYAEKHGIEVIRCPANWDKYGRAAGYRRNEEMAILSMSDGYTGVLLAFWDGLSRGTKHMIDLAEKHNVKVYIIKIKA